LDRRRAIAMLVCLPAVSRFLPAHAQDRNSLRRIGFLNSGSVEAFASFVTAFREGLRQTGYIDGQNAVIDYRWADGDYHRLPVLAAQLNAAQMDIVVATGGAVAALAAKDAITTAPIVFVSGIDPVKFHLVADLNRPGGTVTGVFILATALDQKRVELLHDVLPKATVIAMLVNPKSPNADMQSKEFVAAAHARRLKTNILKAATEAEIDAAFAALIRRRHDTLIVAADPFFNSRRHQIVKLAARHAVPAIYEGREFVAAGGLISYGPSISEAYRQAGTYTGRILKGEKPANLPVLQPTRFELVVNLKAAKALGISFPHSVLARVDEVIE
jgi:putative ABC transport system substrate-binding protein